MDYHNSALSRLYVCIILLFAFLGLAPVSILLWFIKRNSSQFINQQGRELINLFITQAAIMAGTVSLMIIAAVVFLVMLNMPALALIAMVPAFCLLALFHLYYIIVICIALFHAMTGKVCRFNYTIRICKD